MSLDFNQIYSCLREFDFETLLVEELHWSTPVSKKIVPIDDKHTRHEIARFVGVPVFEVIAEDGTIPDLKIRDVLRREISPLFHKEPFSLYRREAYTERLALGKARERYILQT